jgi:hypothetical protein
MVERATPNDKDTLLLADPVALTQRQMLMRLDARLDVMNGRVRKVEDEQLVAKTERRTLKGLFLAGMAAWPVVVWFLSRTTLVP